MRLLLTHGYFLREDVGEQAIMKPYAPLGILYIAAYLEEQGVDASLYDTTFSSREDLHRHLLDRRYDAVGIYTNLMTKLNVLKTIAFIKGTPELAGTKVILGGPEVTHHIDKFLEHGADVIVIGEGEETMHELARAFEADTPLDDVRGIAFRGTDGAVVRTPARDLMKDIDRLPMPKRSGIDLTRYLRTWREHHGKSAVSVSTMRGCPYSCRWCSRAVYGDSYRRRSPTLVVEELSRIRREYAPDTIWFVDDVFTINHRWLEEFARLAKERDAVIPYECITRADRLNERAVELLKESGCFRVWIGAESGSQKILDAMDRRVTVEQVREMIQLSKRHGIETGTFIMLGYPGETEKDILDTIDHLKRSDPDHFTVTVAYPIAGTPLFEDVGEILTAVPDWAVSTDREIDFQRPYSRRYYRLAMSRIYNTIQAHKLGNKLSIRLAKHHAKALAAAIGMRWERRGAQRA